MATKKALSTRDANKLLAQQQRAQENLVRDVNAAMNDRGWHMWVDGKQCRFDERTLGELIASASQKGYTLTHIFASIVEFESINKQSEAEESEAAEEPAVDQSSYNPWA